MEHRMKLRHQKTSIKKEEVSPSSESNLVKPKEEEISVDIDSEAKNSSASMLPENDITVPPPCLIPAAVPDDFVEQRSMPVEPPSLQAHVSESTEDADMSNWRSLPRRAKRPAPPSPVRKPPKKRGRPKVNL